MTTPPQVAARLHVDAPLGPGAAVTLDEAQAHYLRHVLRLGSGDPVAVFNGRDGEWRARVAMPGRRGAALEVEALLRPQRAEPDLWLLFAPVKHGRIDLLVEKATELGAALLWPVLTRRTVVSRVNLDRLAAHAREAAEQAERLSVPALREPVPLERALAGFPPRRRLLVCAETGAPPPLAEALRSLPEPAGGWAILIGPEGGFAPDELDAIMKLPFVSVVGLGPLVLRADTAALAAIVLFQALAGDWRHARRPA